MSINLIFSASVSRIVLLMSVQLLGWAGLGWPGSPHCLVMVLMLHSLL